MNNFYKKNQSDYAMKEQVIKIGKKTGSIILKHKGFFFLISLIITAPFTSFLLDVHAASQSSVGTNDYPQMWPAYSQRTFHANGHFWIFWFNGSSAGGYEAYSSSVDGVTWSNANMVNDKITSSTRTYSVWFDGTYVYNIMVYFDQYNNYYMVYTRGTPNSDGTITWGKEQSVLPTTRLYLDFVQISVDSNGYPWIAYEAFNYTDATSYPFVIRSSTNDGTWNTPEGFPYQLSSVAGTGVVSAYGQGVYPLTSGKMVVFYGLNNVGYAQAWTGSAWLPQININGTLGGEHGGDWQWSAVSQGDSLNIASIDSNGSNIDYFTYNYGKNSFSSVTHINASAVYPFSEICISLDPTTSNLYVFYVYWTGGIPPGTGISYVYRLDGKWSITPASLVNASIASALGLSVSNVAQDGFIGIMYVEYPVYNVTFTYLNLNSSSNTQPTNVPTASPTQLLNWLDVAEANGVWIALLIAIIIIAALAFMKEKSRGRQPSH